jgi:hypothetical protein
MDIEESVNTDTSAEDVKESTGTEQVVLHLLVMTSFLVSVICSTD